MAPSPDPVEQAAEHQRFLLDMVGDDDPAVVQAETPEALRTLFDRAGDRIRTRPEPGEWSVLEAAGHILDAEVVYSARYRWSLAHDEPRLIGYDLDLWVERHNESDPEELRNHLAQARRALGAG